MRYSLLIYSNNNQRLHSIYAEAFDVHVVDTAKSLIEYIQAIRPQLLIMDAEIFLIKNDNPYALLMKNKIFHDLPVIAYYSGKEESIKYKLYEYGVKGICSETDTPEYSIEYAFNLLSRSNPNVGSDRDIFIKSFLSYEDAHLLINDTLYLANYLIRHFRIEPFKASNIRVAIILLTVGFKKRKIRKVVQLIETLDISSDVLSYLKNYHNPSTLEEKIIVAAIATIKNSLIPNLLLQAYKSLESDIILLSQKAIQHHKIYIASTHDIYVFTMRFNKILSDKNHSFNNYVECLRDILFHILVRYGNFYAQMDNQSHSLCISATIENKHSPFDDTTIDMLHCFCNNDHIEFKVSKYTLMSCMTFDTEIFLTTSEFSSPNHEGVFSAEDPITHVINASSSETKLTCTKPMEIDLMKSMRYEEHQKISAKAFLEEFEYDSSFIDDLNENENDAKNVLYFDEEISPQALNTLISTLMQYAHILNESIEFRDLAYSIDALIKLLQSLELETIETEKKKLLKTYLSGIFENLESWKNHIFFAKDSPDIHYLDASLFSDCTLVESLFLPTVEDASELEFF